MSFNSQRTYRITTKSCLGDGHSAVTILYATFRACMDQMWLYESNPLQWHHNGHGSVSNHQPHDCLLNRLFRHRSKKTLKLRVAGLCAGNSPDTGEFSAQMASNAENVSISWRHHDLHKRILTVPLTCAHGFVVLWFVVVLPSYFAGQFSVDCKCVLFYLRVISHNFLCDITMNLILNYVRYPSCGWRVC